MNRRRQRRSRGGRQHQRSDDAEQRTVDSNSPAVDNADNCRRNDGVGVDENGKKKIKHSDEKCNNNPVGSSINENNKSTCSHFPDTRYADFAFWKPPLPTIDDEIAALLRDDNRKPVEDRISRHQSSTLSSSTVQCLGNGNGECLGNGNGSELKFTSEFNEFNFWRVPVAEIDIDLSRILASNER